MISESHVQQVFRAYKEALNEASIPPRFTVSTKVIQQLGKFLGSRRAASTVSGAALGITVDEVYHLLHGIWQRIDDWMEGQTVDIEKLKKYADKVSQHADARSKAMIHDMALAIEDHNWIKVSKIQKALLIYGEKIGYEYDENEFSGRNKHHHMKEDDGGAMAGGAPTNNVGGGHIAGVAGDPPGPRTFMKRKALIRRKRPLGEAHLKHGRYEMVGISFEPRPVMHYAAVNKNGKYRLTTSVAVAKRHAKSGRGR